jgi:Sec-independent protein translocase protein TatA
VGFGSEILFILVLALLFFGPRQLHALWGHVASAKDRLAEASRGLRSQIEAEFDVAKVEGETESPEELN